jgi:serine/threonine protein kinase
MSPEQVRGHTDEIDLRSDVYSLGVILYELISSQLPLEVQRLALPEAMRVICEEPPQPLTRTYSGTRKLDTDLVTIVAKALEKEPGRRYQSAAALSEDLQRHLTDRPILARPPSATYQFRKLVARHKAPFVFIAALIVLLLGFAVTMTIQAGRIEKERDRANLERDRANREAGTAKTVSEFLVGLFQVSDPGEARGRTVTAKEILDTGAAKIETELSGEPLTQARLMGTMGTSTRTWPSSTGPSRFSRRHSTSTRENWSRIIRRLSAASTPSGGSISSRGGQPMRAPCMNGPSPCSRGRAAPTTPTSPGAATSLPQRWGSEPGQSISSSRLCMDLRKTWGRMTSPSPGA